MSKNAAPFSPSNRTPSSSRRTNNCTSLVFRRTVLRHPVSSQTVRDPSLSSDQTVSLQNGTKSPSRVPTTSLRTPNWDVCSRSTGCLPDSPSPRATPAMQGFGCRRLHRRPSPNQGSSEARRPSAWALRHGNPMIGSLSTRASEAHTWPALPPWSWHSYDRHRF
jgi:hypothetical protein